MVLVILNFNVNLVNKTLISRRQKTISFFQTTLQNRANHLFENRDECINFTKMNARDPDPYEYVIQYTNRFRYCDILFIIRLSRRRCGTWNWSIFS